MKYKLYDDILRNDRNILSHIFLNSSKDVINKVKKNCDGLNEQEKNNMTIDITLTIEGIDVDPQKWYQSLWNQVCDMVEEKAQKMVKEQISEKFYNMNEKICEYEKIIESWTNDINWETENPFKKDKV